MSNLTRKILIEIATSYDDLKKAKTDEEKKEAVLRFEERKDRVMTLLDDLEAITTLQDLALQAESAEEFRDYTYAMDVIDGDKKGSHLLALITERHESNHAMKIFNKAVELGVIRAIS